MTGESTGNQGGVGRVRQTLEGVEVQSQSTGLMSCPDMAQLVLRMVIDPTWDPSLQIPVNLTIFCLTRYSQEYTLFHESLEAAIQASSDP